MRVSATEKAWKSSRTGLGDSPLPPLARGNAMVKFKLQMRRDGDLLRAELTGERSPLQSEMARHSQETWDAIIWECRTLGLSRVLVVSRLTGWLSTSAVYSTIAYLEQIAPPSIEQIAYVDLNPQTMPYNAFAQKLAGQRGRAIAVFKSEDDARTWLAVP
jgi:hypothetical protein